METIHPLFFSPSFLLRFLLVLVLFLTTISTSKASPAHDVLSKFGFPRGVLPAIDVHDYSLSDNGDFVIQLSSPCYAQFSDLAYYEGTITGKISYGIISDLTGVQVRKFFVWFPITSIVSNLGDGTIKFESGFLSEIHPASEFEDIRPCKANADSCFRAAKLLPLAEV